VVTFRTYHYILNGSIETEVHTKALEIVINWKKYKLALIVAGDIEAIQDLEGMKFTEISSEATP